MCIVYTKLSGAAITAEVDMQCCSRYHTISYPLLSHLSIFARMHHLEGLCIRKAAQEVGIATCTTSQLSWRGIGYADTLSV